MHMEVLSSAGMLPIKTVGAPGAHGAGMTGTHGMGVRTPPAVAVAVATVGLVMEQHVPKVAILTIGI